MHALNIASLPGPQPVMKDMVSQKVESLLPCLFLTAKFKWTSSSKAECDGEKL